jgi:hypothetical protein
VGMTAAVHVAGEPRGLLGVTGGTQRRPAGGDCADSERVRRGRWAGAADYGLGLGVFGCS